MKDRVSLAFLLEANAEENPPLEPVVPFPALYLEDPRICTAVLERTAVLASMGDQYQRVTARHDQVLVDPSMVEFRAKTADYEGRAFRPGEGMKNHRQPSRSPWRASPTAPNGSAAAAARAKTDEEALKNQQQVKHAKEKEMQFLRRRTAEQAAEKEKEEVSVQPEPFMSLPTEASIQTAHDAAIGVELVTGPAKKVKLRHCHRCGEDKPKTQFKTKRGKGVCEECRAKPELKVGRAISEPRVQVGALPPDGTVVELSGSKWKRKSTRRAKAGKRGGRRKKVAAPAAVQPTGHRNGRPSLTFKELIERIVGERDALKARVDELEAERAQAFAQLQEVLG